MSMWFRCSCTLYAVPYNALIVELIAYSIKTDSHAPRDRDAHRHRGGEIKSIPCVAVFKRNAHPKLQKKNEFKPNLFGACLFGRLAQFMHFNHNHRCCSGMWKLSKYLCIELSIQSRQQGKYIDDGKKTVLPKRTLDGDAIFQQWVLCIRPRLSHQMQLKCMEYNFNCEFRKSELMMHFPHFMLNSLECVFHFNFSLLFAFFLFDFHKHVSMHLIWFKQLLSLEREKKDRIKNKQTAKRHQWKIVHAKSIPLKQPINW